MRTSWEGKQGQAAVTGETGAGRSPEQLPSEKALLWSSVSLNHSESF